MISAMLCVVAVVFASTAPTLMANSSISYPKIKYVTATELGNPLLDYKIIDVRSLEDYQTASLPASHSIPYNDTDFVAKIIAAYPDKTTEIVLVCRNGERANRAAAGLVKQGYSKISILSGGLVAWNAVH